MIYAPVNDEEFEVVMQIIHAGIHWVSGLRINTGDLEGFTEEASTEEADAKAARASETAVSMEARKEGSLSEAGDQLMIKA